MDILENGRMIGFDGLYKFRFIDLHEKVNEPILILNRGNRDTNILNNFGRDLLECCPTTKAI